MLKTIQPGFVEDVESCDKRHSINYDERENCILNLVNVISNRIRHNKSVDGSNKTRHPFVADIVDRARNNFEQDSWKRSDERSNK